MTGKTEGREVQRTNTLVEDLCRLFISVILADSLDIDQCVRPPTTMRIFPPVCGATHFNVGVGGALWHVIIYPTRG